MTYRHPVSDPEVFTDEEEPTRPDGEHAAVAMLVADWQACSIEQRSFITRTARRLADISRRHRAQS